MSIHCENHRGWVLNHLSFIQHLYCNEKVKIHTTNKNQEGYAQFTFNDNLFKIKTPFLLDAEAVNSTIKISLKRKKSSFRNDSAEVMLVKSALNELVTLAQTTGYLTLISDKKDFVKNNEEARSLSTSFFNNVCSEKFVKCSGGNTSQAPIVVNIYDQDYILPNNCKFFCCDVKELDTKLPEFCQFNFILLDPPWWNKYIRRRKMKQESAGYKMMFNEEVCALPVNSWLAPEGLVAVWCTNSPSHVKDIVSRWFPKWGLTHVATWYWIKVTLSGHPVCEFSTPPGKQPYERIMFGAKEGRHFPSPPDQRCIVSVPSAIHSHKPPLTEVVKPYLAPEAICLELFARYLLPHWTSAGDQVLALQNLKLFTQIKESDC